MMKFRSLALLFLAFAVLSFVRGISLFSAATAPMKASKGVIVASEGSGGDTGGFGKA